MRERQQQGIECDASHSVETAESCTVRCMHWIEGECVCCSAVI